MRFGGILRETVAACAAGAAIASLAGALLGQFSTGLGVGAGLLVGALNGYAVAGVLERGIPFVAGAVMRMVTFSAIAILAALLLRVEPWAVLLGVAAAQFVLTALAVRRGLLAR